MGEVRFMISEAAKQVRVESHVLRYWEEELDLDIGRTEMGHRYYTKEDIQLFRCIKKLKNEGILLRDLKPLVPELKSTKDQILSKQKPKTALSTGDSQNPMEPEQDAHFSESVKQNASSGKNKMSCNVTQNAASIPYYSSENTSTETSDLPVSISHDMVTEAEVLPFTQLDQARKLLGDVINEVVTANNQTLENNIAKRVTSDVLREMDFLFQAKERQEEEHFRKLDCLIRQQQASRKEASRESAFGRLLRNF
ncbi:MAG: MerR family transcriptional regulator [Ruminococcus sp.]|nr:MerR family transcriptional regulator [Ruminococcus sp.]